MIEGETASAQTATAPAATAENTPAPAIDDARLAIFRYTKERARTREMPHILIVEDQLFSRRLLHEMLRSNCTIDAAATLAEGLNLYLDNAPDIIFLDIDLDGENGHALAGIIRGFDPQAYIVMVTGNNGIKDIETARHNKVAGYVVKPFSKQKIQDSMQKFILAHPAMLRHFGKKPLPQPQAAKNAQNGSQN